MEETVSTINRELESNIHSTRMVSIEDDGREIELAFIPIYTRGHTVTGSLVNKDELFQTDLDVDGQLTIEAENGPIEYDVKEINTTT